jgi:hypothetical protein
MKINTEARSHGVTERKKYDAGFKMQDARCKMQDITIRHPVS